MLTYLRALLEIARADGALSARERGWITHVAAQRWQIALDDALLERAERAPDAPLDACLARNLLDDAVVLAIIDGPINELEVCALLQLARLP